MDGRERQTGVHAPAMRRSRMRPRTGRRARAGGGSGTQMASGRTRLLVAGGVLSFVAGCLVGSSSDSTGSPHCIVTEDSKPSRTGVLAGQVVEADEAGDEADDGEGEDGTGEGDVLREPGCLPGEQRVCGWFDRSGPPPERFVSQSCPG